MWHKVKIKPVPQSKPLFQMESITFRYSKLQLNPIIAFPLLDKLYNLQHFDPWLIFVTCEIFNKFCSDSFTEYKSYLCNDGYSWTQFFLRLSNLKININEHLWLTNNKSNPCDYDTYLSLHSSNRRVNHGHRLINFLLVAIFLNTYMI